MQQFRCHHQGTLIQIFRTASALPVHSQENDPLLWTMVKQRILLREQCAYKRILFGVRTLNCSRSIVSSQLDWMSFIEESEPRKDFRISEVLNLRADDEPITSWKKFHHVQGTCSYAHFCLWVCTWSKSKTLPMQKYFLSMLRTMEKYILCRVCRLTSPCISNATPNVECVGGPTSVLASVSLTQVTNRNDYGSSGLKKDFQSW